MQFLHRALFFFRKYIICIHVNFSDKTVKNIFLCRRKRIKVLYFFCECSCNYLILVASPLHNTHVVVFLWVLLSPGVHERRKMIKVVARAARYGEFVPLSSTFDPYFLVPSLPLVIRFSPPHLTPFPCLLQQTH